MSATRLPALPAAIAFSALCFTLAVGLRPASAQLIEAGRNLELVETASFAIYFPETLRFEAGRLASFAEAVLHAEVGRVGPAPRRRIPVLLTDSFPETNGFYTPLPSDRIVLELAPFSLDQETSTMEDPLRGIFSHELAHALSMGSRSPLFSFASVLFGDAAAPAFLGAPSLMAEGVAIVAESSDSGDGPAGGRGRAWDSLSAAPVRQALAENRRPGFWESSGATGLYPFGSSAYSYGGPFAAWLERRYGRGALARLYAEFGALRFPEPFLIWRSAFQVAFGRELAPLWEEFLDSMAAKQPLVTATRPLADHAGFLTALTAGRVEGRPTTIWADAAEGSVFALAEQDRGKDGENQPPQARRLFDADGHVNRLDLSRDGRFLLVSTAVDREGFPRLAVLVWDLVRGRFTGRELFDLREAAWAGEGGEKGEGPLVGIAAVGMRTDLVRVESAGTAAGQDLRTLILQGGPTRSFGGPVVLADGSLFALVLDEGRSMLVRGRGGQFSVLAPGTAFARLRFLSGGGDDLLLGFSTAEGFYRLARVVGAGGDEVPRLALETTEISGGVRSPALRSGDGEAARVSYVAAFADGEYPADYPFDNPALSLTEVPAAWVPLDSSFQKATTPDTAILTTLTTLPSQAALSSQTAQTTLSSRPSPALPLAFETLRLPSVSLTSTGLPDAAGLSLQGMDLTEVLSWSLDAQYSWGAGAANLQGGITLSPAPWILGFAAADRFVPASSGYARLTQAGASLTRAFPSFPIRKQLVLSLDLDGGLLALAPPASPYGGALLSTNLAGRAKLSFSDLKTSAFPPFEERGWEASLGVDLEARPGTDPLPSFAAEAALGATLPFAGLHARIEAAASPGSALYVGPGGRGFAQGYSSILSPGFEAWPLYAGFAGNWYGRAELGIRLASVEIMRRVPLVGLYARRAVVEAGARGGLVGAFMPVEPLVLASLYVDASVDFAVLLGLTAGTGLRAGVEVEYSLLPSWAAAPWRVGFLFGAGR